MKATVIKFFDADGNEVKNVSTEIELNGELYVKKGVDKQPDYSHLVGMWVKYLGINYAFTKDKWYQCFNNPLQPMAFIDDKGKPNGFYDFRTDEDNTAQFDLSNPLPYNPDTVVGLKELPNDGKTYAECLEDVIVGNVVWAIKGLFYLVENGCIRNENNLLEIALSSFRIHTPTPEPIWKTCRETMWEYDNEIRILTVRFSPEQDESLSKLTKHLNALAYLSEVARRCNGDRVVDFADWSERKYTVIREWNYLKTEWYTTKFNQIAFLDQEARDHSFEVDKHIWNDYYGLPNE